jgi:hypothetical protein
VLAWTDPGHWTAAVAQWVASRRGRGRAWEPAATSHSNVCRSGAGGGRAMRVGGSRGYRWTGIAMAVGPTGTAGG